MDKVRQRVGAHFAYDKGIYGQNIGVAILDSGIYPHKDFTAGKNRIKIFIDIQQGEVSPRDINGHGTHVAGIIAGSGVVSNGQYMGMAPLADLIILRILDEKGNGSVKNVCRAIEWTVKNREKYHIRVMNVSVGARSDENSRESKMLVDAVEYAWDAGIIVVAAAGNNGPHAQSVTSPGTSRKIITVGAAPEALFENQPETICRFSGRGPTHQCICKPDLIAPGFRICSCSHRPEASYALRSGTSMATPVVTGGIALLLSRYPDMSTKEVKCTLKQSAKSLGLEKAYQGWGNFHLEGIF